MNFQFHMAQKLVFNFLNEHVNMAIWGTYVCVVAWRSAVCANYIPSTAGVTHLARCMTKLVQPFHLEIDKEYNFFTK
jgi:hypothetical protein